ncbi:MAG: HYR domain-containing protein [Gaiellaceae bacterium]
MKSPIALCVGLVVATLAAGTAVGSGDRAVGTLELNNAVIGSYYKFDRAYCPAGVSAPADCVRFTGEGTIRGLGAVTTTYTKVLPGVDPACVVVQNNSAVITVAGKGTLEVARPGTICTAPAPLTTGPYTFTVTGGTGAYTGASGTLTFRTSVGSLDGACQCGSSQDTWAGSITVPGREFDLAAPTLSGAKPKIVRVTRKAKQARVRYTVTANDAVDGIRPVACSPRSGSSFKVGKTKVTCSAVDSSGNSTSATFTITVKRS